MIIITPFQVGIVLCRFFDLKPFDWHGQCLGNETKNLRHTKSMFSSSCSRVALHSSVCSSIHPSVVESDHRCLSSPLTMHCTMSYYDVECPWRCGGLKHRETRCRCLCISIRNFPTKKNIFYDSVRRRFGYNRVA